MSDSDCDKLTQHIRNIKGWEREGGPIKDENLSAENNVVIRQLVFIRDEITRALSEDYEETKKVLETADIISWHTSKSMKLPVVEFTWRGITFTMRNNFYDIKVSVNSHVPIAVDFGNLVSESDIKPVYCEGFPIDRVYEVYSTNQSRFTLSIPCMGGPSFTFFWLIGHYVRTVTEKLTA